MFDMCENFKCMWLQNICLNPTNCAFGVHEKILGIYGERAGGWDELDKLKAINEMKSSTFYREVYAWTNDCLP